MSADESLVSWVFHDYILFHIPQESLSTSRRLKNLKITNLVFWMVLADKLAINCSLKYDNSSFFCISSVANFVTELVSTSFFLAIINKIVAVFYGSLHDPTL